jgi:hypothetical protein
VSWEDLSSGSALVGSKSQFRWRWAASKVNLFTVISAVPNVTASSLETYANEVLDFGVKKKGKFRGLQNGVGAIPALVSSDVEPEAIGTAKNTLIQAFWGFCVAGRGGSRSGSRVPTRRIRQNWWSVCNLDASTDCCRIAGTN